MPIFFDSVREQLARCQPAGPDEAERLRLAGHTIKGSAASYGFEALSNLGLALEQAAKAGDLAVARRLRETIRNDLETIKLVYR